MTRKKKQPHQQKRQQVTDSQGWTHVIKGPKGDMTAISLLPSERLQTSLTVEAYASTFQSQYLPQWRESACLPNLTRTLEEDVLAAENVILTKCVCLGLGSLTVGSPTSSYELAALISMLEILGTKHDIRDVVFQDPAFNALDKTFLGSLGYVVVDDPEAFRRIESTTFLFTPHLEVAQMAIALENHVPAVCICNDLDGYVNGLYRRFAEDKKPGSCDIFQRYLNYTITKALPEFDRTTWTHETNIYWVKDTDDKTLDS